MISKMDPDHPGPDQGPDLRLSEKLYRGARKRMVTMDKLTTFKRNNQVDVIPGIRIQDRHVFKFRWCFIEKMTLFLCKFCRTRHHVPSISD